MNSTVLVRLAALVPLLAAPLMGQDPGRGSQSVFQAGDQILLDVEGDSTLTHTFPVGPGPAVTLPVIGAISLAGVPRGEVEPYLTTQLARYLKNPVVHAKALVRLSILGEVERPGFYAVPTDGVVSDALMAAGGPTREAKFTALEIERDGVRVWAGSALQQAIAQGRTVDAMGLRSGDRIIVPRRRDPESTIRILGMLATIPAAIFVITKAF
ncbi:MAG TPA: polysaccharide biosynthesis/export family protein [Gemmatimonadales bacterium]|nr:polysaccharide biosynthesis/export family protein [Gemmatimonadales bacterium]